MWCSNRSPGNPNNYIWGTYVRPQTPEDKLIRNLAGAAVVFSLFGVWRLFAWLRRPRRQPARPVAQAEDLFKDW